jgi:hypothetical protein
MQKNQSRELASRENHGIAVVLLWDPNEDSLSVSVADSCTGDRFEVPVERSLALDAFYHPFAYAA